MWNERSDEAAPRPARRLHGVVVRSPEKRDSVAPEFLLDDAAMLVVLQRRPSTCPKAVVSLPKAVVPILKAVNLSEGRRPVRRPSYRSRRPSCRF